MNTQERKPAIDIRESPHMTNRKIPASLKLSPSSSHGDSERKLQEPSQTEAGDTVEPIPPQHSTEEEQRVRMREVLRVIAQVENATQCRATAEQRVELADWLVRTRYTLSQVRAAGETITVTETYGRPFAREFWFKAFAEPIIPPRRIQELCRQAYEKGRKDEREETCRETHSSGMDAVTKRLLEAEKELVTLRDERTELKARIHELERECRALQRHAGESSDVRVYRKGDRLIVEHYRKDGFVYYHEQHVDETDIPSARGRRMPEAEFDRQIAEQNVSVLTEDQIARLPGSDHW